MFLSPSGLYREMILVSLHCRLSKYFHGDHHLEGIMLMENIPRSHLLTLIDKFSEVLVTCTLPEHSTTTTSTPQDPAAAAGGVASPSGNRNR